MPGRMMPTKGAYRGSSGAYTQVSGERPSLLKVKQNRIAARFSFQAEGSTSKRLSLGL
jgi:hypothetical protein